MVRLQLHKWLDPRGPLNEATRWARVSLQYYLQRQPLTTQPVTGLQEEDMAHVVYSGVSADAGLKGSLFQGMKFWLSRTVPFRSSMVQQVKVRFRLRS
jgi:hypothetical protein